jgi:hypothetical protein
MTFSCWPRAGYANTPPWTVVDGRLYARSGWEPNTSTIPSGARIEYHTYFQLGLGGPLLQSVLRGRITYLYCTKNSCEADQGGGEQRGEATSELVTDASLLVAGEPIAIPSGNLLR